MYIGEWRSVKTIKKIKSGLQYISYVCLHRKQAGSSLAGLVFTTMPRMVNRKQHKAVTCRGPRTGVFQLCNHDTMVILTFYHGKSFYGVMGCQWWIRKQTTQKKLHENSTLS